MIRLELLGALSLRDAGENELHSVLTQPKRVALLAFLSLKGELVRRDALLGLFWPELDQERARTALRQAVFVLRRGLGAKVLLSRGNEEIGIARDRISCDTLDFERAVEEGRWVDALALYRGDLLEGFFISGAPEFEKWLDEQRARLRKRAGEAAWALAEEAERTGDPAAAAGWADRAIGYSADDEGSVRRLVGLLDRIGDRAAAIRAYEAFEERLERELGIEPSPETRSLIGSIRTRQSTDEAGDGPGRTERTEGDEERDVAPAPRDHREPVGTGRTEGSAGAARRGSLWQVLGAYAVGAWIALQVVDVLSNNFGLPDWFPAFALGLLVIGLPIVLATALIQGWPTRAAVSGRAGATFPGSDREGARARRRIFTWRNTVVAGGLAFATWGVIAAGWLLLRPEPDGGGTAADSGAGTAAGAENRGSIAVLPFDNRSAVPEDEFFVEGIHDDILNHLARIADLKVISRTSVMRYRETDKTIPEIAAELGVGAVLEGGVQRAGDRVRLNVQLIDARTDGHLWANIYDEELTTSSIFAIQSDIARHIAGALEATLAPGVEARIEARPTESLRAYDLYARGRYLSKRSPTRQDRESAMELFQQAIALDPDYALPYVDLAEGYLFLWGRGFIPAEQALPQARAAVETALELDETLAEAHATLGSVLTVELRLEEAEQELRRALELNPNSSDVHRLYARLLLRLERFDESVQAARRAVELDPLVVGTRVSLASRLFSARDYDGVIEETTKVLELEPDDIGALFFLGGAYTLNGQHAEGIAALERALALDPDNPQRVTGLAWAYARSGQRERALELLSRIAAEGPMLKEFAIVYGELGELDTAFEFLDRAYGEDPGSLAFMRADPTADALRPDPRFAELLTRLGLE